MRASPKSIVSQVPIPHRTRQWVNWFATISPRRIPGKSLPDNQGHRGGSNEHTTKDLPAVAPVYTGTIFMLALLVLLHPNRAVADSATSDEAASTDVSDAAKEDSKSKKDSKKSEKSKESSLPKHKTILKDAKPITGMIKLYQKENKLYAELNSTHYNSEYIVLISIARGIGEGWIIGGMSWNDDWVWAFRKINKRVHILRKNVRFRASQGTPESYAVKHAYTDSVLFSLPVVSSGPEGGDLIDVTPVFMSDLPQISQFLPGFSFSSTKSSWAPIKGFKDNIEVQVAATYSSSGRQRIDSVADTRGVTVNVHYSISKLPKTGYTPRFADDRIGYFLTVIKDYSNKDEQEQFTRYINRWNVQKADSSLKLSPPKKPVIFWIENTVPFKYRKTIRDGILEWNRAFTKCGVVDAVQVRQQPNDSEWDPGDINYNTIRWMTAEPNPPFSGIGPSRVNPYTGQILDADILLNSNMVNYFEYHFETMAPNDSSEESDSLIGRNVLHSLKNPPPGRRSRHWQCQRSHALARELAFGHTMIASQTVGEAQVEAIEKLVLQGLKATVMHEVGHTLGLRHNFKGSSYLSLEQLNDTETIKKNGMLSSVMDYDPANIVPQGQKQGNYFTPTIGPYDIWAIEYGYKPLSGGTKGEQSELQKIASRSAEPGLAYATDEDTRGTEPDPESGIMDLGNDAVEYAKVRVRLVKEAIPEVVERMTEEGDSYAKSRRAFNSLLHQHSIALYHASRYVGGINIRRSHKGDKDARLPLEVVGPEKQREALALIEDEVFGPKAYLFPVEIYSLMLSSRWDHWGATRTDRPDYPIHDGIGYWQSFILQRLLSTHTLSRIHDNELKVPADQDAMTTAELIERLTHSIFSEVEELEPGEYTSRKPAITSLRRSLQRQFLRQVSYIALGRTGAPDDCQTIAYAELLSLADRAEKLLNSNINLDSYTRAHLLESANRIRKIAEARLTISSP